MIEINGTDIKIVKFSYETTFFFGNASLFKKNRFENKLKINYKTKIVTKYKNEILMILTRALQLINSVSQDVMSPICYQLPM